MKNKRGFTLVEMIGIIILLTVIVLVVAPTMISTLKGSATKKFNSFKVNLKIVTESYIAESKQLENGSVKLDTLKELKYIEEIPSIPKGDPLAGDSDTLGNTSYVTWKKESSGYVYELCNSENDVLVSPCIGL